MMAAVFSMQGVGQVRRSSKDPNRSNLLQLVGGIVMLVLVAGFQGSLQSATSYATCQGDCAVAVDKMWRVLIGRFFYQALPL
jgi:MFS transporter, PHS family, inorganic phosphate transporter